MLFLESGSLFPSKKQKFEHIKDLYLEAMKKEAEMLRLTTNSKSPLPAVAVDVLKELNGKKPTRSYSDLRRDRKSLSPEENYEVARAMALADEQSLFLDGIALNLMEEAISESVNVISVDEPTFRRSDTDPGLYWPEFRDQILRPLKLTEKDTMYPDFNIYFDIVYPETTVKLDLYSSKSWRGFTKCKTRGASKFNSDHKNLAKSIQRVLSDQLTRRNMADLYRNYPLEPAWTDEEVKKVQYTFKILDVDLNYKQLRTAHLLTTDEYLEIGSGGRLKLHFDICEKCKGVNGVRLYSDSSPSDADWDREIQNLVNQTIDRIHGERSKGICNKMNLHLQRFYTF